MKRNLPPYVYPKGRRGYLYFVRGGRCERIHAAPGTREFALEYAKLLNGVPAQVSSRTFKKLIASYKASDKWAGLKKNTLKSYTRHIAYFEAKIGTLDPASMRRHHVIAMRDELSDKPTDASRKVSVLSILLEHAIDIGWITENPAKGVKLLKGKRDPRQPWPQDLIDKFRAEAGGTDLLLFDMLIGTGQRVSDVLAMQWAHIDGDGINVRQGKTGAKLFIPFTARLSTSLAAAPRIGLHIIAQENGRPWSYNLAWKRFMSIRRKIGAEGYDIHALRHTAASELAALGLSDEHIMAITGHSSREMAQLYSLKAAQRARAIEAQGRRNGTKTKREF